jgi:hypothetical protein
MVLMSSLAPAATYYVDQTRGNDANAGTSQSAPWRNAPGMSAYSGAGRLAPGDTVYFDRNDVWLVTGAQGLYLVGGVSYIGDSWAADGELSGARAAIRAAGNLDAGVIRFRDHATIPTVFSGFNIDANGTVSSGIDINHRYSQLMNGAVKRVENVEVHHISSRQSRGEYKYGIAISNWAGSSGITERVEIINAVVHDISRDAVVLYPGDGVEDRVGSILVRSCEIYNTGQDPDYGEGHGVVVKGWVYDSIIENNYIHNVNSAAVFFSGPENDGAQRSAANVHVRNNILTTQADDGVIRLYKKGAKDIKIYGNLIFDNTQSGGLSISGNSGLLSLYVYNNTFYNAFVDFGSSSSSVQALEFRNNIVVFGGVQVRYGAGLTLQSNNLLVSTAPGFKNPNARPTGFVGVFGVDLRPNDDGFSLLADSTALDAGASLTSAYSTSVNSATRPQGAAWDIGAYEMGGATARPAPPTGLKAIVQ